LLGGRLGTGCSSHDGASWVTGCARRMLVKHGPGLETLAALSRRGPRALKGTPLLRISGKRGRARSWHGSLHLSAQFGVPVTNTWASTRGITSFARRIVNPPAEVEALGHEEVSESAMGHSATSVRRSRRSQRQGQGVGQAHRGHQRSPRSARRQDPRALLDLRPHCGCGNGLRARPREEIIEAQ
jgi:hypothetical protein